MVTKIIRWTKKPIREIPLDSIPGGELAKRYAEMARLAHAQEIKLLRRKLRESYKKQQLKFMLDFARLAVNQRKN